MGLEDERVDRDRRVGEVRSVDRRWDGVQSTLEYIDNVMGLVQLPFTVTNNDCDWLIVIAKSV